MSETKCKICGEDLSIGNVHVTRSRMCVCGCFVFNNHNNTCADCGRKEN